MKKLIVLSLILVLVTSGCSNKTIESLEDESVPTFDVSSKTDVSSTTHGTQTTTAHGTQTTDTAETTAGTSASTLQSSSGNGSSQTADISTTTNELSTTQGTQTSGPVETTSKPSDSTQQTSVDQTTLDEKFAKIDFYLVSGVYSRKVLQEDVEITEMFTLDKTNFVRVASGEFEQEVYAYNYVSDNFTYLYLFDGELVSKTVFNVDTGAILQDINGYSEYLKADADELKSYFTELIRAAGIEISEIS